MPCAYILSCSYSFADNRSRGWRERCSRLLHFPKIALLVAFILYRRSCVNIHTLIFCTSSTFVEILYNAANMYALGWWCAVVFSIFVYPPQYTLLVSTIYFSNVCRNLCGLLLAGNFRIYNRELPYESHCACYAWKLKIFVDDLWLWMSLNFWSNEWPALQGNFC